MKKTFYVLACALCTLLVLPAAAQVPSYVPTDGLVGWWPFNGNANDESGNGNDGVVNGATLTEDRFGLSEKAYYFSSIDCATRIDFDLTQPSIDTGITIALWIKRVGNGCLNPRIFEFYPNGPQVEITNSGALDYFNSLIDSNWNFIVYKIDNDSVWTYLNGILDNAGSRNQVYPVSPDFSLGRMNHPSYDAFNGLLDDIGIWNRALTEQEIQNLYTGQCPTVSTNCTSLPSNLQQGLVGYWPFCGNANDESGNGNDGVVNGATLTEDRFGNANAAYEFDGDVISTDFIVITGSQSRSVSFWFRTDSINPAEACLVGFGGTNNCGSFFDINLLDNQKIRLNFGISWIDYSLQNINLHSWNCVSVISNESEGNGLSSIHLFLNGEEVLPIGSDNSCPINTQGLPLRFGRNAVTNVLTNDYLGQLDDICIWNRALTPEEVQELYTLDACTFTVYDTLTVYETVYDTVYTYETIYDTVTTYVTVTDTLLIDITFTGFEGQPSWLNTVTVFPNPASDHITIDYGNFALMAGYNTIITDAAGATVYSSAVNSQQVSIDINAWGATGVYYMSIYDASGVLVAVRHIVLE